MTIGIAALAVLLHYITTLVFNPRAVLNIRNPAYLVLAVIGYWIFVYGGFKQLLFFIPSDWYAIDEYGEATSWRNTLSMGLASLSLFFIGSLNELVREAVRAEHLEKRLEDRDEASQAAAERERYDLASKIDERDSTIEQLREELREELSEAKNKAAFMPAMYHETGFLNLPVVRDVGGLTKEWSVIDKTVVGRATDSLLGKLNDALRSMSPVASFDASPIVDLCPSVRFSDDAKTTLYLDKTSHPYGNGLIADESVDGLLEVLTLVCLLPFLARERLGGDIKVAWLLEDTDCLPLFMRHKHKYSQGGKAFAYPWGVQARAYGNSIEIQSLFAETQETDIHLRQGWVRLDGGRVAHSHCNSQDSYIYRFIS